MFVVSLRCQEECYEDATVKTVIRKIEKLTGIPDANSEHLQLLKYEEGQFYMTQYVDSIMFEIHFIVFILFLNLLFQPRFYRLSSKSKLWTSCHYSFSILK